MRRGGRGRGGLIGGLADIWKKAATAKGWPRRKTHALDFPLGATLPSPMSTYTHHIRPFLGRHCTAK